MATTVTKRISGAIAADATKRVATSGASAGTPASLGSDTWGGTWGGLGGTLGNSWGKTWYFGTPASGATAASPAVDATKRVSGAITETTTKRVSGV